MRITERKLRKIIKSIISEDYDPDKYIIPGSYGALKDEEMSIEEMEEYLERQTWEIERLHGYNEVIEEKRRYKRAEEEYKRAKKAYEIELRGFVGDVIDVEGK